MSRATNRQHRWPETTQWRVYLMLAVLLAALLSAVIYSFYSGNKATQTYAPLVNASMEIQLKATTGHLWFEEILSGDQHENIETVWHHLDQSAWYAKAMLKGGTSADGTYTPLANAELQREIEDVADKLAQFRAVAEQRYAAREQSVAGTEIDEQFDAVFRDFMMQADAVETVLQKLMIRERQRFILMQSALILFCLILAVLVVVVLRHERARLLDALTDRQQAVEGLSASEERFRTICENAPVLIDGFDENGKCILWNRQCRETFGWTLDEITAHGDALALFYPDPAVRNEVQQTVTNDPDGRFREWHPVTKDGRTLITMWANFSLPDGQVFNLGHDITERKSLMEELRREKELLQFSMEASRIGAWYLDLTDHTSRRSIEHDRIFGYEAPLPEWTYEMFLEHVLPEDREKADRAFQQAVATQTDWNFECRIRRADDEIRWIGAIGRQMLLADGNPRLMTGIVQDITGRKDAEIALQKSRDYIYEIANSMEDIVLSVGIPERKIEWVNNSIQSIGYEPSECIGESTYLFYQDETAFLNFGETLKKAVAENRDVLHTENVLKKKNGESFDVEITVSFHKVDNKIVSVIAVLRDITDRKQAEQELQEAYTLMEQRIKERTAELQTRKNESETLTRAMINLLQDLKKTNRGLETAHRKMGETNQELEAFAYSVSHDLRAPLRHIEGFVNLLLKREAEQLDDTSARYLDTIAHSSNRMGQLIDDLLAFSRTGRTEMHLKPVDSNDIVQKAIDELSSLTKDRRIVWEIADLPSVMADSSLLRLIWNNLIGNAVKYTAPREEARIEIGATEEKSEDGPSDIAFFIRDNGVGFDPQYIGKLFGVFQRLHRDDEFEGTGIGLATVKRIVHRHGGQVRAEGEVDQGATFYFTLKGAQK